MNLPSLTWREGPSDVLVEADDPRRDIRTGSIIAFLFFVVLLGWAALAPLDAGVYARGAYVNSGGENQGYYWGSRRYPYTTDLTKNPLTLRYIQSGVPLPEGIPVNFGSSGVNNAEVHSSGEVWAVTLWEWRAAGKRLRAQGYAVEGELERAGRGRAGHHR